MTLLHLASAQTNDSETPPPAQGSLPTIHRRAAAPEADALGPPPKFVAAPPLDVSKLSLEECAALAPEIMRYMAYENEKSLWNLRKIAGTGSPYDLSVCKAADEAFDNAANASGSPGKNFDLAAKTAYAKGTECRNALDAFYAKECAASEDADCRTAEADKR
ncbi:MAG: hypothetical protein NTX64_18870 [Elusimicrobia bacterium]|nr:hypothetical protein [Elusimicrobiota bacterium]